MQTQIFFFPGAFPERLSDPQFIAHSTMNLTRKVSVMNEKEREERKIRIQEVLQNASLGGKTAGEKELKAAEEYLEGRMDLETFRRIADRSEIR